MFPKVHSPSRIPCPLLQRVAGTAGTHKGKKKGDPSSEPGVLTLVPPPAPLPSAPSPHPGCRRLAPLGAWHRATQPSLVEGAGGQHGHTAALSPTLKDLAWPPLPIPNCPPHPAPCCLSTEIPQGLSPQSGIQTSLLSQDIPPPPYSGLGWALPGSLKQAPRPTWEKTLPTLAAGYLGLITQGHRWEGCETRSHTSWFKPWPWVVGKVVTYGHLAFVSQM